MSTYSLKELSKPKSRGRGLFIFLVILGLLLSGGLYGRHFYNQELGAVSSSQTSQIFTIAKGTSVSHISVDLQKQGLIKNSWAMGIYVNYHLLASKLQAGTYSFSPNQGTASIVRTLSRGDVQTNLVTILPGRRIDQVRSDLINAGYSPDEVDLALVPSQYKDLPIMAIKPAGISTLEGMLWPDSYERTLDSGPSVIIKDALKEMYDKLTPDVMSIFSHEGLTTYQGLTLASIITQEVSKPVDQVQVAQVFLSRIKMGMVLGSDVTAYYGAINAGIAPSLKYDSPYNSLIHLGLPPTPISSITANALNAATHPSSTNWLYFVAGDNGTTYFSTNLKDHEALTAQYCHKLCSL
jgi:UPF0755 protein